jgi:methionine-rich copper-binding protein CopC
MRATRRLLGWATGLLIGCVGAVLLASPASAHSVLLSTTPVDKSQVASAPAKVALTFNEAPRARYSTIHVVGPDGQRRDSGSVQVIDDAATESLGGTRPAGKYTVDWRVISTDGHPVSGQFTFTATAAAAALGPRQPDTNATATKSGSSSTGIIIGVVAVVVVVGAGYAVFLRRRKRTQVERSSFS